MHMDFQPMLSRERAGPEDIARCSVARDREAAVGHGDAATEIPHRLTVAAGEEAARRAGLRAIGLVLIEATSRARPLRGGHLCHRGHDRTSEGQEEQGFHANRGSGQDTGSHDPSPAPYGVAAARCFFAISFHCAYCDGIRMACRSLSRFSIADLSPAFTNPR